MLFQLWMCTLSRCVCRHRWPGTATTFPPGSSISTPSSRTSQRFSSLLSFSSQYKQSSQRHSGYRSVHISYYHRLIQYSSWNSVVGLLKNRFAMNIAIMKLKCERRVVDMDSWMVFNLNLVNIPLWPVNSGS